MYWTVLQNDAQVLAVHAALLHTGHIIYFGGDEHDQDQNKAHNFDHTRLFDCLTGGVSVTGSPTYDVFCCGHCLLADGRLVVAGGTQSFPPEVGMHHDHFIGLRNAAIYDPVQDAWSEVADMNPEPKMTTGGGRWYPTLITLADGQAVAVSGHPLIDDTRHNNDSPELYSPTPSPKGRWKLLTKSQPTHAVSFYPRLHLMHNGEIFSSTPTLAYGYNETFDPAYGTWRPVCEGPSDPIYNNIDDYPTTSILLPLLPGRYDRPHILLCGGRQPLVLDVYSPLPSWRATLPRRLFGSPQRRYMNAVLLPTGDVFVSGGVADNDNSDASAVLEAEIYHPEGNWDVLPAATVPRNYHSVALLMPDGRVWTAGSNHNANQSYQPPFPPDSPPGWDNRELRIEIFTPDYYSMDRPIITQWTSEIPCGKGQTFDICTTHARNIRRVAILRCSSCTHAYSSDQRYVGLTFQRDSSSNRLIVDAPPSANIAPPGYYLLFVINDQGTPSVGQFICILP